MPKNKGSNYKISTQHITLGYIILICLGYLQNSLFYVRFNIDIALYLNLEEYLLIFLPIGSGLIAAVVGLFTYIGLLMAAAEVLKVPFLSTQDSERHKEAEDLSYTPLSWSQKSTKLKVWYVIKNIFFAFLVFLPFTTLVIYEMELENSERLIKSILLAWALVMLSLGIITSKKENRISMVLAFGGFFLLLVIIIAITTISKADGILAGNPNFSITMEYKNKEISSNDNLVYIGQTKDFIFLRNLTSSSNIIYAKKDVTKVVLTKITDSKN